MKLDYYFQKGSNYMEKNSIDLWLVTAATLTLNAFGLLYLFKDEFYLFIALIFLSQIIDMFDKYNRNKYNTGSTHNYNQIIEWIKLLTIFFAFTRIYAPYITNSIIAIVLIILILSNIDYSIKQSIDILSGKEKEPQVMVWTKLYRKIKLDKLKKLERFTDLFNENMAFFYVLIVMIYIHVMN